MQDILRGIEIKEFRIDKGDFVLLVPTLSDIILTEDSSVGENLLTISPIIQFEEY